MISVPLYIFLFIYFFFLIGFAAFFFINLGHFVHTGTMTFASFFATVSFLVFSTVVLMATFYIVREVSWQQTVTLWNMQWLGSIFSNNFVTP